MNAVISTNERNRIYNRFITRFILKSYRRQPPISPNESTYGLNVQYENPKIDTLFLSAYKIKKGTE